MSGPLIKQNFGICIEPADPGDFATLAALDRKAWVKAHGGESIPDGDHAWRIWCTHALVLVARDAGAGIVGAAVVFPCLDGTLCLHKIMLAEAYRGQGLGRDLMKATLEALDKLSKPCFLTVDPKNDAAIRLYGKLGFVVSETVEAYYGPGQDRHIMVRNPRSLSH